MGPAKLDARPPSTAHYPMLRLPQKQSLEQQTATILREQIVQGAWPEWLPGERSLGQMLQVSRHTLRRALKQLRAEGLIAPTAGLGNRVTAPAPKVKGHPLASQDVGLLIADELEALLPTQVTWIDELRAMLAERDCRLHVFSGRKYAQREPDRAIRQLLSVHPHRCWVLLLAVKSTQAWFERNRVPCVVAGTLYSGIDLPFCDVDNHAICRHAAGIFAGRGHRHLALMMMKRSQRAGDLASEMGFKDGARQSSAQVSLAYHDGTPTGIAAAVGRMMQQSPAPTAVLITSPFHYLSALSALVRLGHAVPERISLISRHGEPYLSYLIPSPAYYKIDPKVFAKTLLVQVVQMVEGGVVTKRAAQIMPPFHPGQSVRALPVAVCLPG